MHGSSHANAPEPNWDNVPEEFRYLIDVTKALSAHCGQLDDFHPTDEEMELMAVTAATIRSKGGSEKIMDWVIDHEEFWIVGRVLALINFMGFDFS